jgi:DNA-binding transcriptional MerR regulator
MPYTVSEIAEILADAPGSEPALIERIRHWTREGLIQPIGLKHPGTGRHREYEDRVLLEVSVLEALAGLGLKVGQQQTALKLLKERTQYGYKVKSWIEKRNYQMVVYLAFSDLGGEKPTLHEVHAQIIPLSGPDQLHTLNFRPVGDAAVLINISQIIESVSRKLEKRQMLGQNDQPKRQA